MPGAMTSAIALWIFSSLHKQSWENIQVIRVRHCDHWFQELKIDTWPSERPWDLLPSLEASSCLCLYCHSWRKFFRALSVWLTCSHSSSLLSPPLSLLPWIPTYYPWSSRQTGAQHDLLGLGSERDHSSHWGTALSKSEWRFAWDLHSSGGEWRSAQGRCFIRKWVKTHTETATVSPALWDWFEKGRRSG